MNFIRANPDKFMDLTLSRISDWWLGTGGAGTWTGNWKLSGVMGILVRLVKALLSAALTLLALAGCFFAWRRRKPVGLLVAVILIYPIPYYFFFVTSRYRFPIEPLLLLLAVFGIVEFASVLRPANRGRLDQGNASGARAVTLRQRLSGGPDALNETAQIAR
jgi:cbb3-type cytochrome oxidase subunit 3